MPFGSRSALNHFPNQCLWNRRSMAIDIAYSSVNN